MRADAQDYPHRVFPRRHLSFPGRRAHRLAAVGVGAAIAVGAVAGLAIGIIVSLTTDLPAAPEAGLALGALLGWLSRRNRA
jgi:hypothetical protein